MALLRIGGLSLAGLLLLVLLGCSTETSEVQQGVAPPYEPRSFDQVKPENVDPRVGPEPSRVPGLQRQPQERSLRAGNKGIRG